MEPHKKRRVFGALPFGIGLLTAFVALLFVSDPNARHAIAALGVAVAGVGLVVIFRMNRTIRP
jgi:hypothetical protein